MSRPIYGIGNSIPCVYSVPKEQRIETYTKELNKILVQFQVNQNINSTKEQLTTLKEIVTTVIGGNGQPAPATLTI